MNTIEQIKYANRKAGRFFFEPETLRFFRSRVSQEDGVIKTSLDTGVSQREGEQNVAEAIVRTVKRYVSSLEFLDKLIEFRKAAFALSEAWDNLDDEDHAAEKLCKAYPFKESFDEECHQILYWEEVVENDPAFGKHVKEAK